MKKIVLAALLAAALPAALHAQDFMEKAATFSYNKDAHIYLESGDSLVGPLMKVGYRKGLIDEVRMRINGEKREVDLSTVRSAYLPIAALGRISSAMDQAMKMDRWDKSGTNVNLLNDGYVLFEKSPVVIKGETQPALVQLLNPGFADKIRVYADFNAVESNSYGVGGVTLMGGDDLSYYVRKGDAPAERLRRKDFKGRIAPLFGDCPTLAAQLEKNYDWTSLHRYIYQYTTECQ